MDDNIDISDDENDMDIVEDTPAKTDDKEKVNGLTEEEECLDNSTSDIEDNDIRETLSDDSEDKIQVV